MTRGMESRLKSGVKRVPTLTAGIVYLLMVLAAMALFAGRNVPALRLPPLLAWAPDAYSHMSNFSIAFILVAGIGYAWLMAGVALRWVLGLALSVALINLAYEAWLPFINTRDMVDAAYGLAGVVLATVLLVVIDRWGMRPAP